MKRSLTFLAMVCLLTATETSYAQTNVFPTTGNVGIGTTAPDQLLTLTGGNLKLHNPANYPYGVLINMLNNPSTAWAREYAFAYNGTGKLASFGVYAHDGVLNYAYIGGNTSGTTIHAAPWMVFLPDGNVGIGTRTPGSYKLAVDGTIGARKIKVTQAAWADFVFDPEYKLMPLAELELYVRQYRRLPEIPSAETVASEGLDLGDINKRLLQKVEEQSLYIIELNKKLQSLSKRLEMVERKTDVGK